MLSDVLEGTYRTRIGTAEDFAQQFHDDMMAFWRRLLMPV